MRLSNQYCMVRIAFRRVKANWGTDGDFITPAGKTIPVGENHTLFMMANPNMFGGISDPEAMVFQGWIQTRGIGGTFSINANGGMNTTQLEILQKMVRDRCKYSDPSIEVLMNDDDVYKLTCNEFEWIERPHEIKRGPRFV